MFLQSDRVASDALALALTLTPEVTARVRGGSMMPFYREGSRIRVVPPPRVGPLLHRVVVFEYGGKLIAHRVVAEEGEALACRGDARGRIEHISRSEVVGVVRGRRGGLRLADALSARGEHLVVRTLLRMRAGGARIRSAMRRAAG